MDLLMNKSDIGCRSARQTQASCTHHVQSDAARASIKCTDARLETIQALKWSRNVVGT
jgi:hypothetical protein